MPTKIIAFLRENPIPLAALIGLMLGAIVRFILARPDIADVIWLAVLVIGGAPTIWKTIQKIVLVLQGLQGFDYSNCRTAVLCSFPT